MRVGKTLINNQNTDQDQNKGNPADYQDLNHHQNHQQDHDQDL